MSTLDELIEESKRLKSRINYWAFQPKYIQVSHRGEILDLKIKYLETELEISRREIVALKRKARNEKLNQSS